MWSICLFHSYFISEYSIISLFIKVKDINVKSSPVHVHELGFLRIFTFEEKKIVQNYKHNCIFMPVINKHGLVRALIIVTSKI